MNKQGFTLIELLVVVLIIGILSAIALPQYQAAVEKSRMSEAMILGKAISDGIQRYQQANPNDTTGVTTWLQIADVDLKGGIGASNTGTYKTNLFVYTLTNGKAVQIVRTDDGGSSAIYTLTMGPDTRSCTPGSEDPETAAQMCTFFEGL